jgi:hypothetical protein
MRKVAHYFYDHGRQVVICMENRRCQITDQVGDFPSSPKSGLSGPHPSEGCEDLPSYEEIGLYYGYGMSETGWSGDC